MRMKYLTITFVLLVLLAVILAGCQSQITTTQMSEANDEVDRVIKLTANNYSYSETSITVNQGQTVRIELTVSQGLHDWVVDEFSAATSQAGPGNTVTVVFIADEPGEFEYYCSVGNHREMGMVGTLIVE